MSHLALRVRTISITAIAGLIATASLTAFAVSSLQGTETQGLKICVDNARESSIDLSGSVSDIIAAGREMESIHTATLASLDNGANLNPGTRAYRQPLVVRSCPEGTQSIPERSPGLARVIPGTVNDPSPYLLHAFMLEDAKADLLMGERLYVRSAFEVKCFPEDICAEVSVAMFVRQSAMADPSVRARILAEATGLLRPGSSGLPGQDIARSGGAPVVGE